MSRIEGTGNINNAINIELNTIKPYYEQIKTFGDGFATSHNFEFERNITGLEELITSGKFNFDIPQYPKGGFTQFAPLDDEYQTFAHLDKFLEKQESLLCE